MKLYQGIGPNSYRVRIFMAEKGIDLPMVDVDIMNGEHRKPAFRKLNSLSQIPVLELEDGTIITESVAICRYIEELHPTPALFGRNPVERAKVEMWNRRAELELFATTGNVALHTIPLFAERVTQFPEFAETQKKLMPEKWRWLESELSDGRQFLAGEFFSIADITGGVVAWLGGMFDMPIPEDAKRVRAWRERVTARKGWEE